MTQKVQAIAGVSASSETEIRSKYPTVAATGPGQLLGNILELIPIRIWGIKISNVLFGLALAPIALAVYGFQKIFGDRYALTNRSVQRWKIIGSRMTRSVALTDVANVVVQQQPGQVFFRAADVYLMNAKGDPVMVLEGVAQADIFRQWILEARDARLTVEQSLKTIKARTA